MAIHEKGHYGLLRAMRHLPTNQIFDTSTTRAGKTPTDTASTVSTHCYGLSISATESQKGKRTRNYLWPSLDYRWPILTICQDTSTNKESYRRWPHQEVFLSCIPRLGYATRYSIRSRCEVHQQSMERLLRNLQHPPVDEYSISPTNRRTKWRSEQSYHITDQQNGSWRRLQLAWTTPAHSVKTE